MDAHQAAQSLHRFHQRQRARTVIDVTAGFVLRPGSDEQDADGRGDHRYIERTRVRQASTYPRGLCPLEKEALAVVQQFPGQAQQERGGFLGC
jgi:hypothetical protein